jgi:chromosome segregation protein
VFLKRIDIQGFKSFADRVSIHFDSNICGIVGPNGCGKSNITDAIRWVLGEQSVKSLRGSSMTDVIFTGSTSRRRVNLAEVTLVFDNSDRSFDVAYDEVEITRRLHRENAEGEYFINKSPCRLKDILDLTMDSGIGRDSLSIISQGSITELAEAKPEELRTYFEEAAGVAKYKKRKREALNKLEHTQTNLERMNDIFLELQKQVLPLKKAAQKAKIYAEKKARLNDIEITVLTTMITRLKRQAQDAEKELFSLQSKEAVLEASIQINENGTLLAKTDLHQLDHQIHHAQEDLLRLINEIQTLETRKIEIDEKRKYTVEVGTTQQKKIELKQLLAEAKQEYEDRQQRFDALQRDIDVLNKHNLELNRQLIEQDGLVHESTVLNQRLQNRLEVVKNLQQRPFMSQAGVQAVLAAKHSLAGVYGVVSDLISPHNGYEEAISVALGGSLYNIVTTDEASARHAIQFLKKNESGRATFLPMNVLQSRWLRKEDAIVAQNTPGYLGTASTFVACEPKFNALVEALLANVLVVENLEQGNQLAALTHYAYKLVTLEGDVIHKGGSMTGGKQREGASPMTLTKEVNELTAQQASAAQLLASRQSLQQEMRLKKADNESQLVESRIAMASLEPVLDAKRAKYERLRSDFSTLSGDEDNQENPHDDLITLLNKAYSTRDALNLQLRTHRETRLKLGTETERKEQQMRQQRRELSALQIQKRDIEIEMARSAANLENLMVRLSQEYQLTYEFALTQHPESDIESAQEEVKQLRQDIEALGNINMDAPAEFDEINTRYEFIQNQYRELSDSRDKILNLIRELDEVMVTQFNGMMIKINQELPGVVATMFGGGTASVALEDPSDPLNSGIDIHVQPPGKSIKNIRLFSGGEKSLIAISLLFAILKARHVPMCIFDEVEAALDQSNVERFARYLKQFSQDTQFLVVTHRPGTMAQCDLLYGVTMGTTGVSEMLKVKLTDAVKLVETEQTA